MKAMLDRLAKADPETYQRAFDWLKNVAWSLIKLDPEGYFLFPGPYPLRDALLQAVLQGTITSRGWWLKQSQDATGKLAIATIGEIQERDYSNEWNAEGASLAGALLAAYIAAIEVQA